MDERTVRGDAGDVTAGTVVIRQAGARPGIWVRPLLAPADAWIGRPR